ncbi:MAG: hypothetical protein IJL56_03950 [Bacteroidales bacterium]|jgi:hypothetical protein|nr:hypothetical protein [Bacteroidales bacterium]
MAEDNINIQMRLVSVGEVSFMMSPGKVGDDVSPDSMKIGFSTQIQPDVQNDIFVLLFGTRYELNGEVVLESIYKFVFEVKNLAQFVVFNDNQSITVNHIMPHFLSVAVGTMRGILVVKTAGTNFSNYPLPMIDVNQLNSNLSTQK